MSEPVVIVVPVWMAWFWMIWAVLTLVESVLGWYIRRLDKRLAKRKERGDA